MASKKAMGLEAVMVNGEAAENEMAEGPYDPWKDMRRVFIPKRSRTEQSTLEVGVNDKTFFLPKEKWVEVPEPIWEVVTEMLKRQRIMEEEARAASGQREFSMSL